MSEKKVLILGGAGFIGRNLVKYLVDNKLAKFIRVADKSLPVTSYLNAEHKVAFDQKDIVEFKQADLSKDPHVAKVFADHHFDYVVNLCGETRCGCSEAEHKQKSQVSAEKCSIAAAEHKVDKWVEVSTAQVYEPDKKASKENAKLKPWTLVATNRLAAEELVKASGVAAVVLRPATVYGHGDLQGITPRILTAVTYAKSKEKLKFLWTKELGLNTVHVLDLCCAIWASCTQAKAGSVYNVADAGNLTQGALNAILEKMFDIKATVMGTVLSSVVKLQLKAVADSANDKHVPAWARMCEEEKIMNTPLSPYIDKELLSNNSLTVDGTEISNELEFKYAYPAATKELLTAQMKSFEEQGLFPGGWLK